MTSYNSTEFGVPLNGPPPTKYTWLGAAGVSSESSGLITQDGVTYVPQTGRPLQTQGVAPPTAENKATAYISMISPGVEASAAVASAQQVANAEQAKSTVSGEGIEEAEGEEDSGGEGGGDGCSGMDACAASNDGTVNYKEKGNDGMGCRVWGSWGSGEFLAGEISAWGHWECAAGPVPGFEMQIEVYGEGAAEFEGNQVRLGSAGHKITKTWGGEEEGTFEHTFVCPATGSWYHLWFWGREWGLHGGTKWSASGWEAPTGSCTKQGAVDMSPIGQAGEPS